MSIQVIRPAENPYAGLFSVIGAIMGNKAKERGERKNAEALTSLYAPIEPNMTNDTFQDQASRANLNSNYMGKNIDQQTAQGLLPTGFQQQAPTSDMIGQGLLGNKPPQAPQAPQRFFADPSIQTDQQPATTPLMGQYAKENNPVNVSSTPKDWNGIQKDIQAQGYKRIQEMSKNMSPDEFRKNLPIARQLINDSITQSKGEYDQKKQDEAYLSFETESDPKKKIMIGMKAGLIGKEGAMMLIQPNVETKVINTGGANVVVGFDKLTGKYVNLKDGAEIPADELQTMLQPTLTPAQQADEVQRQYSRDNPRTYSGGGGGGGSNNDGKYVTVPGLGRMTPNQVMQAYRQASGGQVTTDDGMGGVKTRTVPPNPDMLRMLKPFFQQTRQELNLPQMVEQTGDQSIDSKIQAMRAAGADEQIINDMVWEEQNRGNYPPPQRQQQPEMYGTDYINYGG